MRYCAALGRDPAAAIIRARLEADGLSTAWLASVPCATDESIVYVADSGENCIVSTDTAAKHLTAAHAEGALAGMTPGDVLLLQGNLSREVTVVCLTRARAATATTIVNPAPIDFDYAGLWPLVGVVILNQIEARMLTGEVGIDAASAVLRGRGAGNVILTLGSEGALVREGQGVPQRVPAPGVTAVDTTGAGDVLAGVVAAGIDRSLPLLPVVRWRSLPRAIKSLALAPAPAFRPAPSWPRSPARWIYRNRPRWPITARESTPDPPRRRGPDKGEGPA